jgi:hypothetical protein
MRAFVVELAGDEAVVPALIAGHAEEIDPGAERVERGEGSLRGPGPAPLPDPEAGEPL